MRPNVGFRQRRLTLTPLIDVIFLLLLFFMLSSTFTRFGEINLMQAGPGAAADDPSAKTHFVRLTEHGVTLDGTPIDFADLTPDLIAARGDGPAKSILSLGDNVRAQLFIDALARMQAVPDLSVMVLQ